jgi:hypothetical protein
VPHTRVSPTEFLRRQAPQKLLIRFVAHERIDIVGRTLTLSDV